MVNQKRTQKSHITFEHLWSFFSFFVNMELSIHLYGRQTKYSKRSHQKQKKQSKNNQNLNIAKEMKAHFSE